MIGDKLELKPHHYIPAKQVFDYIESNLESKYCIAIGGESGCGKSTLAVALKDIIEENGKKVFIFHMDDYFFLPPTSNHNQRLSDISCVGPQEVNLKLLQQNIDDIKEGATIIEKPLVHYKENEIRSEQINFENYEVIIIEGTYTLTLEVDLKIFMQSNYKDTHQKRIERARDPMSPFVESVLEIEHNIIKKFVDAADILIDKNYHIKYC